MPPSPAQHEKAAAFRALHEGEPFILPNPWDAGSARVLAALGFRALASTSSGFAFTLGRFDGEATLDEVLEHVERLDGATPLPVSVDLENGHGPEPEAAAVEAARGLAFPFTLTARAENHIRGHPDLEDTIARLRAYERAGADVLYAPGLRTGEEVRAVCEGVSRPVNVLAHPDLTLAEIAAAGGRRVSLGGGLTWIAVGAMAAAAERMRDAGDFSALAAPVDVEAWLGS